MVSPTYVSLYSGCGGMDLGFARAGFRPVWANDIDATAVETYNRIAKVEDPAWVDAAAMFVGHQAVTGDIRQVVGRMEPGYADLVIGGPPCQGFSVAGRMDPNDPRSKHVFDFLGVVARVRPRAFVMENVAALARNKRWEETLEQLMVSAGGSYEVQLLILNASHWGVAQARERMFLVGLPKGTGPLRLPEPPTIAAPPSAGDVLRGLPAAGLPGNESLCRAKITLAKNPVKRRSPYAGMLFNGQGRPMDLSRPAPTLPASMGGNRTPVVDMDQLESNATPWVVGYHERVVINGKPALKRLPKEARLRRLTVQEAAAIQTFPRDLDWQGPQSARFRQVGNAVPPVLAWHVAEALHATLAAYPP